MDAEPFEVLHRPGGGTLSVRPAVVSDAAALAELARRTFVETFGSMNDPADVQDYVSKVYGASQQKAEIEKAHLSTIVVEESGQGLVAFAQLRRGKTPSFVGSDRAIEIARFYVDSGFHGAGVAQALMRAVEQVAHSLECDAIWLGVWQRNPRAIAFYAKCGFRRVGEHPFLLGRDLQTDDIMARPLPVR